VIVRELIALLGVQVDKGSFSSAESKLAGFAKAAIAAFAGFKAGQWVAGAVRQTAALADQLEEMSARTGVATDTLQRFAYVGSLVGVSLEGMEQGTKFLSIAVEETKKKGSEAGEMFRRLGVRVRKADGTMKSVDELLPEVSDGMTRLKSDTERVAVAQKLFGRAGTRLLPLLKQGSAAIREQFSEAESLGGLLDEELIQVGGEVADNQDRLAFAYRGVKNAIAKGMLPWILKMQRETLNWIKVNGAWLRQGLARAFEKVGQVVSSVTRAFGQLGAAVAGWYKKLDPVQKTLVKVGAIFAGLALLLMLPGGAILLLIGLIGLLIDDFQTWREGGKSVIGDLVESLNEFFGIDLEKFFGDWWQGIKRTVEVITQTLFAMGQFIYDLFDKGIAVAWGNLCRNLEWIWGDAWQAIKDVFDGILYLLGQAWDWFVELVKSGLRAVGQFFADVWNGIVSWVSDNVIAPIADFFIGLWEGIKAGVQAVWDFFVAGWKAWHDYVWGIVDAVFGIFKRLWDGIVGGFKTGWDNAIADGKGFLGALGDAILGALKGWFDAVVGWASDVISAIAKPFKAVGKWIGGLFGSEAEEAGAKAEAELAKLRKLQSGAGATAGVGAGARWTDGAKEAMSIAARPGATLAAPAVYPMAGRGGGIVNQPSTKIDVRVQAAPGMSEEVLAGAVARQVAAATERENRATMRALVPAAAGE